MDVKDKNEISREERNMPGENSHRWFLGLYAALAVICLLAYFMLRKGYVTPGFAPVFKRLTLGAACCFITLFIGRFSEKIIRQRSGSLSQGYNIIRVIRLIIAIIIFLVIISFVNANWYTAAVSLGLISLLLGFALQTPISSLIGWCYIIIRVPYKVGDRIQVGDFTGDVVELGYFDTTLWEFAGDYLSNDVPSGRLIRFPNSLVFQTEVYNYSWNHFPYIWNEIPFYVAFESDLPYVEQTIRETAKNELDPGMAQKVKSLKTKIQQTPVDDIEIKEYPFVNFRINTNTWVEVLLVYLVEPKESGALRSRLIKAILKALQNNPDKVLLPKSNSR